MKTYQRHARAPSQKCSFCTSDSVILSPFRHHESPQPFILSCQMARRRPHRELCKFAEKGLHRLFENIVHQPISILPPEIGIFAMIIISLDPKTPSQVVRLRNRRMLWFIGRTRVRKYISRLACRPATDRQTGRTNG